MLINAKAVKHDLLRVAKQYNPQISRVSKEAIISVDTEVASIIKSIAEKQSSKTKTVLPVNAGMEAAQ